MSYVDIVFCFYPELLHIISTHSYVQWRRKQVSISLARWRHTQKKLIYIYIYIHDLRARNALHHRLSPDCSSIGSLSCSVGVSIRKFKVHSNTIHNYEIVWFGLWFRKTLTFTAMNFKSFWSPHLWSGGCRTCGTGSGAPDAAYCRLGKFQCKKNF